MIRRGPDLERGVQIERGTAADKPMPSHLGRLPFAQKLTCTGAEACEVTGLGRTKVYELIGMVELRRRPSVGVGLSLCSLCWLWLASIRHQPTVDRFAAPGDPHTNRSGSCDSTAAESIVNQLLTRLSYRRGKAPSALLGLRPHTCRVVRWKPRLLSGVMCSMPRDSY